MKVRWKHPWWLPKGKRAAALPPFGIWIDPKFQDSSLGTRIMVHELCHWRQFRKSPWTYYPRHIWYRLTKPNHQNPLEIEAYRASGVW